MSKTACPFCNLKQRILRENDLALLVLSDPRKMPGHFLVIPKRHIEKPWEQTEEETLAMFNLILLVQRVVTDKFSEGCDVRQNYRPFLPQSRVKVDHLHYHILPRNFQDELYKEVESYETSLFKNLSTSEQRKFAEIIETEF